MGWYGSAVRTLSSGGAFRLAFGVHDSPNRRLSSSAIARENASLLDCPEHIQDQLESDSGPDPSTTSMTAGNRGVSCERDSQPKNELLQASIFRPRQNRKGG